MILDSLVLNNIRSHKDTKIEFPEGIVLFVGDIGSGKSTILMGIEFALFGLSSIKADSLLAKNVDSGEVSLTFHVGDIKYEVGRTLKRDRTKISQDSKNVYLRVNNTEEPLTATELKSRILDILGLNEPSSANSKSRIYRYAIFTPQDEMKSILWDSAKRLETIRKIFQMENFQIAKNNAGLVTAEMRRMMTRFQVKFEDMAGKKEKLEQTKLDVEKLQHAIDEKSKIQQDHIIQEQKVQSDLDAYDTRKKQRHDLVVQYTQIKSNLDGEQQMREQNEKTGQRNKERIKQLEANLRTFDLGTKPTTKSTSQINAEIDKFRQLHEDITATRTNIKTLNDQVNLLASKIPDHINSGIAQLEAQLYQYTSELDSQKNTLNEQIIKQEDTKTSKIKITSDIQSLQNSLSDLEKLGAKCTLCGQIITKDHRARQKDDLQGKLDTLQVQLDELQKEYKAQSDTIEQLQAQCNTSQEKVDSFKMIIPDAKEYARLSGTLKDLQERSKKLDSQYMVPAEPNFAYTAAHKSPVDYLSALKDALTDYNNEQNNLANTKEQIAHLNDQNKDLGVQISQSITRSSEYNAQLDKISEQLNMYNDDEKAISDLKNKLKDTQESLRQINHELSTSKANLATGHEKISDLESDIKDAKHWQKTHSKFDAYKRWLDDFFIPNVESIEKSVLLKIQNDFNDSYRDWYAQLVNDTTKDSRIDEDFTPIIEQDGLTQQVEYLSGGEKTSVALAYRLALNFAMRRQTPSLRSNLLILDEPTDGMSQVQLRNLKSLLEKLNSKQIILVSHDREIATQASHVFEVVKHSGETQVSTKNNSYY